MSTREASLTTAELRERFHAPDLVGGRYIVWEVSDSGCGMSPEVSAHACEPFFTTKFTGQGLGLAAVLGMTQFRRQLVPAVGAEQRVPAGVFRRRLSFEFLIPRRQLGALLL